MTSGGRLLLFLLITWFGAHFSNAAPTDGVRLNSKAQRTDVPPEEEELEFKDVPIFSNFTRVAAIPRNPLPGMRYVPVRTCNKGKEDSNGAPSVSQHDHHNEKESEAGEIGSPVQVEPEVPSDAMVSQVVDNVMATLQQITAQNSNAEDTPNANSVLLEETETVSPTEESPVVQATDAPSSAALPSDENNKEKDEASNFVPPVDIDDPDSYATEYAQDTPKDFVGYKVYRVTVPTEEVARWLLKFEDLPGIEFWADPKLLLRPRGLFVTSAADLLVAPDLRDFIEEAFRKARLTYEVLIDDVQAAIRNENPSEPIDYEEVTNRNGHRMTWERFHPLEDIESYLDYLRVTFPDFVSVTEIGRTTENRPIRAIRLHQEGGRPNKKTILLDAGIHAREWITPATLTYMIKEIIENPQKYDCIMNQFDWVFIPVLNPDGYVYTHSHNRMWRKTRSKPSNIVFRKIAEESLKSDRLARLEDDPILDDELLETWRSKVRADKTYVSCTGVDANRNFGYKWLTGGSSKNPCLDTYAGSSAFSEPETRAFRDLVLENKDNIAMYVSLHAYSQMWLLPWGFTEQKPDDYSELYSLAKIGSQALEKPYGSDYLVGAIPDLLYIASGSSLDWVKGEVGVKYTYTLELRDAGRYGFLLPANQIVPTGVETWAAMFATANELARRVYDDPEFTCPSAD